MARRDRDGRAGARAWRLSPRIRCWSTTRLAGVLAVRARDPLESDTLETLESVAGMIAQGIARLRAQDALRASEERFRAIVDQQTDLICRFRPDTTLTFVNDAYARHFGKMPGELLGHSFLDFIPAEQREAARAHIDSLHANPRIVAYEHAAIAADGKLRWHQWIDQLVPDAHGRGMEFQSVGRDVTERRQAEEAIQRSEQIARAQTAIITATLQSITREPTPDSFTGQVLRTIVEQLGGIAGTFWVPADTPGSVRVYLDLEDDRLVKAEDSDHPGRMPQRIIDLQRPPPAQIDDPKVFDFDHISNHPDYAPFREWALRRGVRTVLQVPMVFGADIVGVYTVRFDHERSFRRAGPAAGQGTGAAGHARHPPHPTRRAGEERCGGAGARKRRERACRRTQPHQRGAAAHAGQAGDGGGARTACWSISCRKRRLSWAPGWRASSSISRTATDCARAGACWTRSPSISSTIRASLRGLHRSLPPPRGPGAGSWAAAPTPGSCAATIAIPSCRMLRIGSA